MATSRMSVVSGSQSHRNQRVISAAMLLALVFLPLAANGAPQPTQTSLALSTNQAMTGQPGMLTATVTSGGMPAFQGTITFLNGNNKVLGTVQVTGTEFPPSGIARLTMRFPPGV